MLAETAIHHGEPDPNALPSQPQQAGSIVAGLPVRFSSGIPPIPPSSNISRAPYSSSNTSDAARAPVHASPQQPVYHPIGHDVFSPPNHGPAGHGGVGSTHTKTAVDQERWQNLQNLKNLLHAGFITKTEYNERKSQLIDEMTGTKTTISTFSTKSNRPQRLSVPTVVPKLPPDFSTIEPEEAIKHIFDMHTGTWRTSRVMLKLDPVPFSKGSLRLVYHMQDISSNGEDDEDITVIAGREGASSNKAPITYVAKISMDPRDNNPQTRQVYFNDVEMQSLAKYYAKQFNAYNPPKKVDFVKAWIYELLNREGQPICGVERFIDGPYRKHNNNYGYVSEDERNTPQAFSHFTYEASQHKVLIVDIQGVGDMYTDPQVHSIDGRGFGKGNMGQKGIDRFLHTHRCNMICRYLKLPAINANYNAIGTLPVNEYMAHDQVAAVTVSSVKDGAGSLASAQAPLLPKRIKEKPPPGESTLCSLCVIL